MKPERGSDWWLVIAIGAFVVGMILISIVSTALKK